MKSWVWRRLRGKLAVLGEALAAPSIKQPLIEQEIRTVLDAVRVRTPDNPVLDGYKVYSQVDEDGVINAILRRVGVGSRVFFELGCGNGLENNTHYLALQGWRGVWVDGSSRNIDQIVASIPLNSSRLLVERLFITRDNIAGAISRWVDRTGVPDLLSLDIDGNDAAVLESILQCIAPRVVIVEYNGKFPPPLRVSVAYNPAHGWTRDDYYGSSLQVFVDLMQGKYALVSCGVSGANAYFVRQDMRGRFTEYSPETLYMSPRHHLICRANGGAPSLKHLRNALNIDGD